MRYMVMETHLAYAVVLDEEGHFLKAANLRYEPGDILDRVILMEDASLTPGIMASPEEEKESAKAEIASRVEEPEKSKDHKKTEKAEGFEKNRKITPLYKGLRLLTAAAAACLIIAGGSIYRTEFMPFGSVYMSINPDVRIDVNSRDRVIDIEAMNDDGAALSDGYSYSRKTFDTVVSELSTRAIGMGYLDSGGRIELRVDSDRRGWSLEHGEQLAEKLVSYTEEGIYVSIELEEQDGGAEYIELEPETEAKSEEEKEALKIQEKDESWTITIPDHSEESVTEPQETDETAAPTEAPAASKPQTANDIPETQAPTSAPVRETLPQTSGYIDHDSDYGQNDSSYEYQDSGYHAGNDSLYGEPGSSNARIYGSSSDSGYGSSGSSNYDNGGGSPYQDQDSGYDD